MATKKFIQRLVVRRDIWYDWRMTHFFATSEGSVFKVYLRETWNNHRMATKKTRSDRSRFTNVFQWYILAKQMKFNAIHFCLVQLSSWRGPNMFAALFVLLPHVLIWCLVAYCVLLVNWNTCWFRINQNATQICAHLFRIRFYCDENSFFSNSTDLSLCLGNNHVLREFCKELS